MASSAAGRRSFVPALYCTRTAAACCGSCIIISRALEIMTALLRHWRGSARSWLLRRAQCTFRVLSVTAAEWLTVTQRVLGVLQHNAAVLALHGAWYHRTAALFGHVHHRLRCTYIHELLEFTHASESWSAY